MKRIFSEQRGWRNFSGDGFGRRGYDGEDRRYTCDQAKGTGRGTLKRTSRMRRSARGRYAGRRHRRAARGQKSAGAKLACY
jgi:hypothetical protein